MRPKPGQKERNQCLTLSINRRDIMNTTTIKKRKDLACKVPNKMNYEEINILISTAINFCSLHK